MTDPGVVSAVKQHIGPLTPLLDDAIAEAIVTAERRLVGVSPSRFPYLRPLAVRTFARLSLEETPLPDGWEIVGDPARMGELCFRKPGVMRMRFLKGNPLQPDGVPHAGLNPLRQEAWRQDPLVGSGTEVRAAELSFLLLRGYADIADRESGFTLTLAHTLEAGKFGARVACDLVLSIPRGGTLFEDLSPFTTDEEVDLFQVGEVELDEVGE